MKSCRTLGDRALVGRTLLGRVLVARDVSRSADKDVEKILVDEGVERVSIVKVLGGLLVHGAVGRSLVGRDAGKTLVGRMLVDKNVGVLLMEIILIEDDVERMLVVRAVGGSLLSTDPRRISVVTASNAVGDVVSMASDEVVVSRDSVSMMWEVGRLLGPRLLVGREVTLVSRDDVRVLLVASRPSRAAVSEVKAR